MERAILVGSEDLVELRELAVTAGALVVAEMTQKRSRPDPATYLGKGKVEELREAALAHEAEVVIFDNELSPGQSRNIEEVVETKIVDRTGLILDIFAARARTKEGQLQVELAQLTYNLSRLSGDSKYLSRLGGGIGTRGPGEMKLEVDRRRIRQRIATLRREIELVRKHRQLHRERRRRSRQKLVSLAGYTNAGKSTLFRALSGEDALISGRLFSTLDTLTRKIKLTGDHSILVSDTVGFIRKLPHALVTAFRATLEEVAESDLILHVIDASDPELSDKRSVVLEVLEEIGAGVIPRIEVYNKIDLAPGLAFGEANDESIRVSAKTRVGLPELMDRIVQAVENPNSNVRTERPS